MANTNTEVVNNLKQRLADEQPDGSLYPADVREALQYARRNGSSTVTVKITGGWEFEMTVAEAEAFLK